MSASPDSGNTQVEKRENGRQCVGIGRIRRGQVHVHGHWGIRIQAVKEQETGTETRGEEGPNIR